jgi:hypothetical protein
LIDTHSTKNVENQWHTKWGYDPYFSSYASNSRGVAILFKNPFEFKVHRRLLILSEKIPLQLVDPIVIDDIL